MKKTLQAALVVLVIASLLAGCTAPGGSKPAAAKGPIKVGLLMPLTGNTAASGKDMLDAWNMWWDEHGHEIAGRKIEFYPEDTAGVPDTGLTKARLLVEQRQVHFLVGGLVASVGLAVAEYVKTTGTPYLIPVIAADDLTQRQRVPNVVRVAGWNSSQTNHPLGEYAAKRGYKTAVTIGEDYAFGHESVGGFVNTFTDNGGKLLGQIWHPLGNMDFGPFLAQLDNYKPDVVFVEETGADAVRFVKAWRDMGYDKKYPLLGNQTLFDQSNLRGMGDEAIGGVSSGHYAEGRDAPENNKFVQAFLAKYNLLPSYYAADMYTAARWIATAIEKVNGNVEDKNAFLAAIRSIEFADTPMGPVKLDSYDNTVLNVYLRKVEKRPDGKLWNVVIDTFPSVSQFYKYDPEKFLKQPVYSRSYLGENWP